MPTFSAYAKATAYVMLWNAGGHLCDQLSRLDGYQGPIPNGLSDAIRDLALLRLQLADELFRESGDDGALSLVACRSANREEVRGRADSHFYLVGIEF